MTKQENACARMVIFKLVTNARNAITMKINVYYSVHLIQN